MAFTEVGGLVFVIVFVSVRHPFDVEGKPLAGVVRGVLEERSCFLTPPRPSLLPLTLLLPSAILSIGGAIMEASSAGGMCETSLRVMSEMVQSSW